MVFYGPKTVFYSIAFDDINYRLLFPSDVAILVPGGYGYYKAGAVGKLVALEKKPDLFRKTFSANSFSFTDLYFFPKDLTVYNNSAEEAVIPSFKEIFFSSSNANFFDRIFIFSRFIDKRSSQFKTINVLPIEVAGGKKVLNREDFFKGYQGFLYKKTYRNEQLTVQIIYTKSYKTATLISQILEGEGIRVVDLTLSTKINKDCLLIEKKEGTFSQTAKDIGSFFGCQLRKGEPEISDIIFILGSLEKEWLVE